MNIGTGHVMRCLSLAEDLRKRGAEVRFLCASAPGDMTEYIAKGRGFPLHLLATAETGSQGAIDWERDALASREALDKMGRIDWLIADHYGLDIRWESVLRDRTGRLLVIDDLADRCHACDMLLDQNLYRDPEIRYRDKVPAHCLQLLGPGFALLRTEFRAARESAALRSGVPRRLLIFFGGSDPGDETSKALAAFRCMAGTGLEADVVVGGSNPHREAVETVCRGTPGARFHCQAENMAELMAKADLSLGAGGTSTWERCCVGLPSVIAVLADNQNELAECAHAQGVVVNLGRAEKLTPAEYARAVANLSPERIRDMEMKCRGLVDGLGCSRVAESIMKK